MVREIATIGLGANLGDPVDQIERAVEAIDSLPLCEVWAVSGLYANPPIGPQDQPDYINAVAEIETALAPEALLRALKGLERAAGRSYTRHWGERMLDLDILAFGNRQIDSPGLTVPHPEIAHRHFVLAPWLEIRPDARLPDGSPLAGWLEAVAEHPLRFLRSARWQRRSDAASATGRTRLHPGDALGDARVNDLGDDRASTPTRSAI